MDDHGLDVNRAQSAVQRTSPPWMRAAETGTNLERSQQRRRAERSKADRGRERTMPAWTAHLTADSRSFTGDRNSRR